jgi:hypothetical protein
VTCESNPAEVEALCRCCVHCPHVDTVQWPILGHLKVGQAVALPVTAEAAGELRMFTIAPRLTPHVRHREKYVDVPVGQERAFVFAPNGGPPRRVRTLRQFVGELESIPRATLDPYVMRGDFSRWIGGVFGDHALAQQLRGLEQRHRTDRGPDTLAEIASAIRSRYDLVDEPLDAVAG